MWYINSNGSAYLLKDVYKIHNEGEGDKTVFVNLLSENNKEDDFCIEVLIDENQETIHKFIEWLVRCILRESLVSWDDFILYQNKFNIQKVIIDHKKDINIIKKRILNEKN